MKKQRTYPRRSFAPRSVLVSLRSEQLQLARGGWLIGEDVLPPALIGEDVLPPALHK